MTDVFFDHLFDRFRNNIYGSRKGLIRQAMVEGFVQEHLSQRPHSLRVADIGGGLGQMSLMLAKQGHQVTYCDAAETMCEYVKAQTRANELQPFPVICGRFQEVMEGHYDLVLCQAVLEWLEDPASGLLHLKRLVGPQGLLIVVFYNARAIQLKNLVKGNWRAARLPFMSGDRNSLTPISPIDPDGFEATLNDAGGRVIDRMGVRTFSEYVYPGRTDNHSVEDFIAMEQAVARQEPYLSMARYVAWAVQFD